MDDSELNAIRAARLQELQKQNQPVTNPVSNDAQSGIMNQVLEPSAKERISRVRLVKPERAKAVEDYIARLVQTGALRRKLGEEEVIEMLNGLAQDENRQRETKIRFERRQLDEEDDFFD
ncbi:unnamed protein product [Kuraishia capsulata CBS 1993]|uniref:Programmed cell death protein 5 n=1 Tax=Kuraishia capsulata CBS 1993 TaxID=1382522 RepID=W6MPV3_9ASCO|nr:uncharacterized protein KUCA_T00003195001 [Kuraishia capsulata CBS 1993]CDK27217.1 unnamed protein product [Kuraishia capsulata CBS 1993]